MINDLRAPRLATLPFTLAIAACLTACPADRDGTRAQDSEGASPSAMAPRPSSMTAEPPRPPRPSAMGGSAEARPTPPRPDAIPAPSDVAAAPSSAETTASGLASRVLQPGSGTAHPGPRDTVVAHYTGWTTDGEMFDSSVARGAPSAFPLNGVIPGWTEGVQLMVQGEKRRFWIPVELAYQNRPGRPAGMLVFDVELLRIEPVEPETPSNVAAPPADAERTPTGIASVVIHEGWGTEHPTPTSTVQVLYSGWTTDGEMFDSSLRRGRPASFPLTNVIPGWTQGIPLMVPGEKRRFWIPANLAYEGQPNRPQGTLVFDVTLLQMR